MNYRGRFAPTPSGPLHFGSLFAAVVSYLDAKSHHGTWLVRIEDIDPPREQPGASKRILQTLEAHGLFWDETETFQSNNAQRYLDTLDLLEKQERLFWCQCSRKMLRDHDIYPGTCRHFRRSREDSAIRFQVTTQKDHFLDVFQGEQQANLLTEHGDVILRRRDQLFAYQLAVVADDIAADINSVIRGIDLLPATYWQRELYRALDTEIPLYGHFPVLHAQGSTQKLSKQNLAPAIDDQQAINNLQQVFQLMGLAVALDTPQAMLQQACDGYQRNNELRKQLLHTRFFQLD